MSKYSISYLITCNDEFKEYKKYSDVPLLNLLSKYNLNNECIILHDTKTPEFNSSFFENNNFFKYYRREFKNNYSEHKNYGKSLCSKNYIFQIDSDELPSETLLEWLDDLIDLNKDVDLFWLPRINNFIGVTEEHARQWGWDINNPNKWVNWNGGDYQGRLFKNNDSLKWERPLHEKIEGAKITSKLPKEKEFALIHTKTITRQIETNLRYNKDFSQELNRGFKI
jgi:hypothetical protein